MNKLVLAVGVLAGSWALACGPAGNNGLSVRLGHLALDLRFGIRSEPCREAVVIAQAEPVYEAAPMVEAEPLYVPPPPQVYVEQEPEYAPPPVVEAPVYVPPPRRARVVVVAPRAAAPVVVVAAPVVEVVPEGPARLALKYMPGASSTVSFNDNVELSGLGFSQSAGVEYRLGRYFSLRSDGELRPTGRSWDVIGAKLSLFPNSIVRPYGSVSFSLSEQYSRPGQMLLGVMGAGGLDISLGRHFFIEGEIRYRRLPGCCQEESQVTALVGAGVAFF